MRREWICLALLCAVAAAQGIATRNVKPAVREKASGRPWPSRLVNVARQAGLTRADGLRRRIERSVPGWRHRRRRRSALRLRR